jgi:hypothetical protein
MTRSAARLHSLCGTQRRIKKKQQQAKAKTKGLFSPRPCRGAGLWACHADSERFRRKSGAAR